MTAKIDFKRAQINWLDINFQSIIVCLNRVLPLVLERDKAKDS